MEGPIISVLLSLSTGRRNSRGLTLIELMVVVVLIPLLGFTIAQLDIFTQEYFNRITRGMVSEQEVEIAFGMIAKDILTARSITVYTDGGTWASPATPGSLGNGIVMVVDDDHDLPPNSNNDDVIRYWFDTVAGTIVRQYDVNGSGTFNDQIIARNITLLEFTQTVAQPPATENLETLTLQIPQNVVRVRINANLRQVVIGRTRYITSRSLSAIP